jgi:hypothetical protein
LERTVTSHHHARQEVGEEPEERKSLSLRDHNGKAEGEMELGCSTPILVEATPFHPQLSLRQPFCLAS